MSANRWTIDNHTKDTWKVIVYFTDRLPSIGIQTGIFRYLGSVRKAYVIFEGQKQPWDYYNLVINAVRFGDKQLWSSVRNWRSIKIDEEQRGLNSTHCFWADSASFKFSLVRCSACQKISIRGFPCFAPSTEASSRTQGCQGYWSASKIYNLEYLFWTKSLRRPEIPRKDCFFISRLS